MSRAHPPGKGGGYVARNKKPPRQGQEAPFLTGKLSVTCPVSGVSTDYWFDAYQRQGDNGTFYAAKLKAMVPKAQQQAKRQQQRPGGAGVARPEGAPGRPGGGAAARPGGGASARPGSGPPPRPGGQS
jgi:hypothetical protein